MAQKASERLTLQFFGAAGTVTGSKFLLTSGREKILVDCGLFQGLKELRLRNWSAPPFDPKDVRAVLSSHAHIDHSGYLPKLVRQGFRGAVYATPGTCDLLRLMLPDAAHLQEEEARYANKVGYSKHKPALPLYAVADAEAALALLRPTRYAEKIELSEDLSASFSRAGHILGAASVRLVYRANGQAQSLVDSGDLGRYGRPLLRDPDPVQAADWLLIESTYGNRVHPPNPEEELARVVNETAERKGVLIVPAFAVGRTQELIYAIRKLEDEKRIPSLPVHVDSPMAIDATEIYCAHPEEHGLDVKLLAERKPGPLCCGQFQIHRSQEESKALNDLSGPLILITASGMATGGRVLHHLRARLPDPATTVLFVGYQAEGTRGRALQDGKKEVQMLGEAVAVRARIVTIDGFSAHADQNELMRWLGHFTRAPRRTFVIHGEAPASAALADLIREKLHWPVEIARNGQTAALD